MHGCTACVDESEGSAVEARRPESAAWKDKLKKPELIFSVECVRSCRSPEVAQDLVCMCVCSSWKKGHKFYYPRPKCAVLVGGSIQPAEGWGFGVCSCGGFLDLKGHRHGWIVSKLDTCA